jgi:hypothetical protein
MAPRLLCDGNGIGAECSTALVVAGHAAKQCPQLAQGGHRGLRGLDEFHARAPFALDHPLRDDDGPTIGPQTGKDSLARGGHVHPRRGQRLAAERLPWVMDGD